ncbi:MAG: hypothetical protein LW854_12330 [Rubrivivax sp.]|jgi:hypothetical protein|nr:hypothetical protein [Rubrivivax sp.]
MESAPAQSINILPGTLVVTFLVRLGLVVSALVVAPGDFLTGLRAASHTLSFGELCRDDTAVDDLLPWAGNV